MTIDSRLSAALARRGTLTLARFLIRGLGLDCRAHHGGEVCALRMTDEQAVERFERYAEGRSPTRAAQL